MPVAAPSLKAEDEDARLPLITAIAVITKNMVVGSSEGGDPGK